MTLQVVIGIDPGQTGACAVIADGLLIDVFDMPTMRKTAGKGNQVDAQQLAARLRGVLQQHQGAWFCAAMEHVWSSPQMGVTSAASFGRSIGVVEGVLATLGVNVVTVTPQKWKKYFDLIGMDKKAALNIVRSSRDERTREWFKLEKHIGRADATLIGLYAHRTEMAAC